MTWVSMDGVGEYHDRIRGEGSFARLEENIRNSGFKHICVNMVVNALNYESLDAAMEYAKITLLLSKYLSTSIPHIRVPNT